MQKVDSPILSHSRHQWLLLSIGPKRDSTKYEVHVFSGVWFLSKVPIFNGRAVTTIFVILSMSHVSSTMGTTKLVLFSCEHNWESLTNL